jgi:hypothetical protein
MKKFAYRARGARPPVQAMIAFIDVHRGAHGVEPICKVLSIAPSTYHPHFAKWRDTARLSARARQDAALKFGGSSIGTSPFTVRARSGSNSSAKASMLTVAQCRD